MKIHCDVCSKDEASVYCSADEAALCAACDHRVHHANKLAGKHLRFSLLLPSPLDNSPLCDICQEKKAFLFCQQDRAILCKDCDVAVHKVNHLTQKHSRFLLTGVKLSPTSSLYSSPAPVTTRNGVVPDQEPGSRGLVKKSASGFPSPIIINQKSNGSGHEYTPTSSISEYLIETLPGWHVEDFLNSPSPTVYKIDEDDTAPFWDGGFLEEGMNECLSPETMGMWVPQAPPPATRSPAAAHVFSQSWSDMGFGGEIMSGSSLDFTTTNKKPSRKMRSDDGTVPQISPPAKKSRTLW